MDPAEDTEIGQILESQVHTNYICEVYKKTDKENPPEPEDYSLGQFVYVLKGENREKVFVGVITNSRIVDPEQGRVGARLSDPDEQNQFNPGYVDEKQILVQVILVGTANFVDGSLDNENQAVPRQTLEVDDVVRKMPDKDIKSFHGSEGNVKIEYVQRLTESAEQYGVEVAKQIISQLQELKPECKDELEVIRKNLEWKSRMQSV